MQAVFESTETITKVTLPQNPIHFPTFPAAPPLGISLRVNNAQLDAQIALPSALLTAFGTHYRQMQSTAGN